MYGPQIQVRASLIVPAFAAVIAYTLTNGIFRSIPPRRGVPIYRFEFVQCQSEMQIACDGKSLALPVAHAESEDRQEPADAPAEEGTEEPVGEPEGKEVGVV